MNLDISGNVVCNFEYDQNFASASYEPEYRLQKTDRNNRNDNACP